jgi:hypothetical protein
VRSLFERWEPGRRKYLYENGSRFAKISPSFQSGRGLHHPHAAVHRQPGITPRLTRRISRYLTQIKRRSRFLAWITMNNPYGVVRVVVIETYFGVSDCSIPWTSFVHCRLLPISDKRPTSLAIFPQLVLVANLVVSLQRSNLFSHGCYVYTLRNSLMEWT